MILLIFREGKGREKEGEKRERVVASHACPPLGTWPATQACALTGNRISDPLVHRLALNPLSHTRQGSAFFLLGICEENFLWVSHQCYISIWNILEFYGENVWKKTERQRNDQKGEECLIQIQIR